MSDLSERNMAHAAELRDNMNFEEIFGNGNPVRLEIGCGKGKFICETAALNPDVNFVACEKISNVLIDACERALSDGLKNVHFLNCAAEVLERYIPAHSAEKIYLNFSNPLPKEGYKKQRLTHPKFLKIYRELLKEGGTVAQKTDDGDFYAFSLASYAECGCEIIRCCEDLASHPIEGDVETEHERLFKSRGKRIYYIEARFN